MATDTKEIRLKKGSIDDLIAEKEIRRGEPIPDITTLDFLYAHGFRDEGPFAVKLDSQGIPRVFYKRDGPSKDGDYKVSTEKEFNEYQMKMKKAKRKILDTLRKPKDQKS